MMRTLVLILLAAMAAERAPAAAQVHYELRGRLVPEARARIVVYGSTVPFSDAVMTDERGNFRVRKLVKGAYTVAVYQRGRGEARRTIEVGPSTANPRQQVEITLALKDSDFTRRTGPSGRFVVSAKQLSIPEKALKEFRDAQKDLTRRDADGAIRHLEKAVEIAPQFSNAWNSLGTVNYQTRRFTRAEECFRRALKEAPESYEPIVNLGGVLVTVNKLDEAMAFNLRAVLMRPNDALAQSQLGMTYFQLGRLELARKYLERARELDPAHFSHPQLLLAEIHYRQNEPLKAADDLDDFLHRHPDWPAAEKMREMIAGLRK
jgi:tetratricopeptide (TPR) repeat protein